MDFLLSNKLIQNSKEKVFILKFLDKIIPEPEQFSLLWFVCWKN